jgi:hypothetical protein
VEASSDAERIKRISLNVKGPADPGVRLEPSDYAGMEQKMEKKREGISPRE